MPTVPLEEEDPTVHINMMIEIFNTNLPPPGRGVNRGFLHEMFTATDLVNAGGIKSGRQISRPLTAAEKQSGLRGDSQSILAPLGNGKNRGIDMLCQIRGKTYIVEAKDTQNTDSHQLKRNIDLAQRLGGGVMYSLAGEKAGQERALREGFGKLPGAQNLPPLQVIHTHQQVSDIYTDEKKKTVGELPFLHTREQSNRSSDLEFYLGERVSYEDVEFYEEEVRMLENSVDPSARTMG